MEAAPAATSTVSLDTLCEQAFKASDVAGAGRLDLPSFRTALQQVFKQLQGSVPQPDAAWYAQVFANYAPHCGGHIKLKCMQDVAGQYCAHHLRKQQANSPTNGSAMQPVSPPRTKQAQHTAECGGAGRGGGGGRGGALTGTKVLAAYPQVPAAGYGQTSPTAQGLQAKPARIPQQAAGAAGGGAGGSSQVSSQVMFPIGRERMAIFEHYEFDPAGVLGSGAFGEVSIVKHKITGQRRACKCIGVGDDGDLRAVENEVQVLKRLDHPNIVRLSESFFDVRNMYLITELCTGGTLLEGFSRHPSESAAATCLGQILAATAYCHAKGIIHRDFKPGNVLYVTVCPSSAVKVIDFGLAACLAQLRRTDGRSMGRAGTIAFMAPEALCSSSGYSEKVDLWAIGCILYLLLTGEHPFYNRKRGGKEEMKARIARGEVIDRPGWNAASAQLKDLASNLLCVDAAKRSSAADALRHRWLSDPTGRAAPAAAVAPAVTRSVFEGLGRYHASSKLKKAILRLIAKEVDEERVRKARQEFQALDSDRDGFVTRGDLVRGLQRLELSSLTEADLAWVLPAGVGDRISCTDFTAALLSRQGLGRAELINAFRRFDVRREGRISLEALSEVLRNAGPESRLEAFREADVGRDGAIDLEEFCALMAG